MTNSSKVFPTMPARTAAIFIDGIRVKVLVVLFALLETSVTEVDALTVVAALIALAAVPNTIEGLSIDGPIDTMAGVPAFSVKAVDVAVDEATVPSNTTENIVVSFKKAERIPNASATLNDPANPAVIKTTPATTGTMLFQLVFLFIYICMNFFAVRQNCGQ